MPFYPDRYLPRFVSTVRDIYEHRSLLKLLPCTNYVLRHLLSLIVKAVREGRRFRAFDSLKVLRAIIKNNDEQDEQVELEEDIVRDLFFLYQTYVFSQNEDIQWCVSRILKDQVLDDTAVEWLISHYTESNHIVNRLLRYPLKHDLIVRWATEMYRTEQLEERTSEIIALMITDAVPTILRTEDTATILWAIYASRATEADKERLLLEHASVNDLDDVLDIAFKLQSPVLLEHLLDSLPPRPAWDLYNSGPTGNIESALHDLG